MGRQGRIEREFGVPFPGEILAEERWTNTKFKRLPQAGKRLQWNEIFGRKAPIVLDLGCGNGRYIIGSALNRSDHDHLGLDALPVVIRYATKRANQRGLKNVRFAVGNAFEFLRDLVEPGSIREIHVHHPQPYHEKGDEHLRLVTPVFLRAVLRSLDDGGTFVFQTDSVEYWKYCQKIFPSYFEFAVHKGAWPDAPLGRTRREIMARQRRLKIFRGEGRPLAGLTEDDMDELERELPMPTFVSERSFDD